jgi:hypothetical protein
MAAVHQGRVDAVGRLHLADPALFKRTVAQLANSRVEVTVRRRKARRTLRQNAYYWGVVVAILAEHLGYQQDEMHDALKYKFLRTEADAIEGLPRVRSSADLNTAEFNAYVENVVTWAGAEFGVVIPDPGEVD